MTLMFDEKKRLIVPFQEINIINSFQMFLGST